MKIRFTERAEGDLIESYLYGVMNFGQDQADRYEQDLRRAIDIIGDNPRIAPERRELVPPVRIFHSAKHRIIYLFDDDGILIVRILRNERDLTRHL